jgi:hypothetical protein
VPILCDLSRVLFTDEIALSYRAGSKLRHAEKAFYIYALRSEHHGEETTEREAGDSAVKATKAAGETHPAALLKSPGTLILQKRP